MTVWGLSLVSQFFVESCCLWRCPILQLRHKHTSDLKGSCTSAVEILFSTSLIWSLQLFLAASRSWFGNLQRSQISHISLKTSELYPVHSNINTGHWEYSHSQSTKTLIRFSSLRQSQPLSTGSVKWWCRSAYQAGMQSGLMAPDIALPHSSALKKIHLVWTGTNSHLF